MNSLTVRGNFNPNIINAVLQKAKLRGLTICKIENWETLTSIGLSVMIMETREILEFAFGLKL